jgi:hypothetical protein
MEADDVLVGEAAVNGNLHGHLLLLVRLEQQRLGYDLAGEHLLGVGVRDLEALGKAAFAQKSAPHITPPAAWVHQDLWDLFGRRGSR